MMIISHWRRSVVKAVTCFLSLQLSTSVNLSIASEICNGIKDGKEGTSGVERKEINRVQATKMKYSLIALAIVAGGK